jgi:hypothetical protein
MKVAFRLRRLAEAGQATALLVPSRLPEDVLRVCADLACDPLPEIYPIAEGFLLKLPTPGERRASCPPGQARRLARSQIISTACPPEPARREPDR